ncbi:hypothetical protein HDV05_000062 [Chytridiales sp. JEL 0842]|nr:hypothetical protein HDV05_000062 [Chytridiales sp. JEL 0842]
MIDLRTQSNLISTTSYGISGQQFTPGPNNTFDVCYMQAVSGGMQWATLVGCFLIFYCYWLSRGEVLWNVLLVHAISGFVGTLIEDAFIGAGLCAIQNPSLAIMLAVNEVNWTLHEGTTVYYSFLKTAVIITSQRAKRAAVLFLFLLFLVFAGCRAYIGFLRFTQNMLTSPEIEAAHAYAYISWGIADLMILVLLCWNVWVHVKASGKGGSSKVITTLMMSSVPRIAVIFFNTLSVVITGAFHNSSKGNRTLSNFTTLIWLIKGTYPFILLMDMIMTKSMINDVLADADNLPSSNGSIIRGGAKPTNRGGTGSVSGLSMVA